MKSIIIIAISTSILHFFTSEAAVFTKNMNITAKRMSVRTKSAIKSKSDKMCIPESL